MSLSEVVGSVERVPQTDPGDHHEPATNRIEAHLPLLKKEILKITHRILDAAIKASPPRWPENEKPRIEALVFPFTDS